MAKRVYFAFDYEDVSDFRANVVRKHNFTGGVLRRRVISTPPFGKRLKERRGCLETFDQRGTGKHVCNGGAYWRRDLCSPLGTL